MKLSIGALTIATLLAGCGNPPVSEPPDPPRVGGDECPNLTCRACSKGADCADEGPFIGDTCCALGDDFIELDFGESPEVVEVKIDDRYIYTCGGFGGRVFDAIDPAALVEVGPIGGRCENIGIGDVLADGTRVIYAGHRGDSRSPLPYLETYQLSPDNTLARIDSIEDDAVLFDSMAYVDGSAESAESAESGGTLYVASHGGGLRVYATDDRGVPSLSAVIDGFDNALELTSSDDGRLYVTDTASLHILSLANPRAPVRVAEIAIDGKARDVEVFDDRLFLALGGGGLLVMDRSDADAPVEIRTLLLDGSVQGVAVDETRIAVAAWSHVSLLDASSFEELTRDSSVGLLEQDLAVGMRDGAVFSAEWGTGVRTLQYRPGYVAPDLALDDAVYSFAGDRDEAVAVIVRNRGLLALDVTLTATHPTVYSLDTENVVVSPGDAKVVELTYVGASTGTVVPDSERAQLVVNSNDPDREKLEIRLRQGGADRVKVGDTLDSRFGFLDPDGAGQVDNLNGSVLLLAYFGVW